jgi:hypothetical protein
VTEGSTVQVRDLPAGGRLVVLCWHKRIWRCREPACGVRTWTEQRTAIRPRAVLTERARAEACRRVGKDAHAVAAVARDLGVGWATIMRAVSDHGRPLVDAPTRLEDVTALGLDETSFLKATRVAPTRYVTGLVYLEGGRLLDVVADRTRTAVHSRLLPEQAMVSAGDHKPGRRTASLCHSPACRSPDRLGRLFQLSVVNAHGRRFTSHTLGLRMSVWQQA